MTNDAALGKKISIYIIEGLDVKQKRCVGIESSSMMGQALIS